jgi:hypothetical protein
MIKNFYILCALWRALVMKEIYVFLSNKAMAGMIMVYVPMFMFFFAFFLYPTWCFHKSYLKFTSPDYCLLLFTR